MTIDLSSKKSTRTHFDQATDDPKQARSELAGNWRKYDDVLDAMGTLAQMDIAAEGGLENNGSDELRTSVPVSGKTANYMITTTDRSKLIRATGSGGFTLSFSSAATLGDGWYCFLRNDATAAVTLDPYSSQTIDGETTMTLVPGQGVMILCNGSLFVTIGSWNINALEVLAEQNIDAASDKIPIFDASAGRPKVINPQDLAKGVTVGTPLVQNPMQPDTTVTQNHGLPATPNQLLVQATVLSAVDGWAVGDVIQLSPAEKFNRSQSGGDVSDPMFALDVDATEVRLTMATNSYRTPYLYTVNPTTRRSTVLALGNLSLTVTPILVA